MTKTKLKTITLIISILILTSIDLFTKSIFTNKSYGSSLIFIQYSKNFGSSFGIFSQFNFYSILISIISIITLLTIIYYRKFFQRNKYLTIVFILLISATIGNTYDRLIFGYVRDFISLKNLFIFNIADLYFTLSFIFFLFSEYSDTKDLKTKKKIN